MDIRSIETQKIKPKNFLHSYIYLSLANHIPSNLNSCWSFSFYLNGQLPFSFITEAYHSFYMHFFCNVAALIYLG